MVDHELIDLRQDEKIDLDKLKQYLTTLLKINIDEIKILQFSGGHANLTYLISFIIRISIKKTSTICGTFFTIWLENIFNILKGYFPLKKSIHLCKMINYRSKFHLLKEEREL